MEGPYQILQTIFQIVKNDSRPEMYPCTPADIILRQSQDWDCISQHLQFLMSEDLVTLKKLDKFAVYITPKGLEKARSLSSFTQQHFSFSFSHA